MNPDISEVTVRISRKWTEAVDVCGVELVSVDGSPLRGFSAGSHIDMHLPGGLVRQYSLCNDSAESHRYIIGVLKEPDSRGGSIAVHELAEGSTVQISAPRNHFDLVRADSYVLFAGGIGVTPILCMAERLARIGAKFQMHYNARSADRMAFVERIDSAGLRDRVYRHFDDGPAGQKLDLEAVLASAGDGSHLYVCGPKGYMDWIISTARSHGWPSERVHFEYFKAEPPIEDGQAFELQLASSGKVFPVPAGVSAASVLLEQGIDLPLSCESGVCGTCLTRIIAGTPEHHDVYLTDDEKAANDKFTPCCSRARGRLVIDL